MEQSSDVEQDSLGSTPLHTHQSTSGPALCPADPRIQFITHYVSEEMEHSSGVEQDSLVSAPLHTYHSATGPALCPEDPGNQLVAHAVSEEMERRLIEIHTMPTNIRLRRMPPLKYRVYY
eukprot:403757_1